ncbi:hypothetical protein F5887DRAFT_1027220, partial [Amanita rubescens]
MLSALEKLRLLKEQRKKERLEREELERKEIEVLERLLAEEEQCLRDRRAVAALFIVERWEEAIEKTPCRVSAQARRKQSAETEAQLVLNTAIVKIIGRLDGIVEESRRHHAVVERLLRELVEKRKNNEGTRARGEKVAGPSGREIEDYLLYITSGSGNETSL